MHSELTVTIIYSDAHLLELRVSAGNGSFGGTADVYVGIGCVAEVANQIEGFPISAS